MEKPTKNNLFIAENVDIRIIKISNGEEGPISSDKGDTEIVMRLDQTDSQSDDDDENSSSNADNNSIENENSSLIVLNKSPVKMKKKERKKAGYRLINGEMRKVYSKTENGQFQCAECEKQYNTTNVVRLHYTKEHTNRVFNCNHCPFISKTKYGLVDHIRLKHMSTDQGDLKTIRNLPSVNNSSQLKDEDVKSQKKASSFFKVKSKRYIITENFQYKCAECENHYSSPDSLNNHYRREHGDKVYNCNQCSYIAKDNYGLKEHMNVHSIKEYKIVSNGQFQCTECEKQYNVKGAVRSHYLREHIDTGDNCSQCPYIAKDKYRLKEHINTVHSEKEYKEYKCMQCKKRFHNKYSYELHENHPHDNICSHCEKAYINSKQLKKHMNNVHQDLEPGEPKMFVKNQNGKYSCIVCNQPFNRGSAVNRHYRKEHLNTFYNCNHCIYSTKDKYSLNIHMKLRHSENRWMCESCQKAFGSARELEIHSVKAHYFHCGQCDRAFVSNVQLQLHINIDHEGKEMSHLCKICNKVFMHLDKHMEFKHTEFKATHCQNCNAKFKTLFSQKRHKCVQIRYY